MSDKLIDQISAPLVSNYLETAKDLKEQMNLSTVDSNISSNLQISQVYSYLSNLPNDADAAKKKDVVYNWSTYMSYKYGNDDKLVTSFSGNPINASRVNADSIGSLVVNGKTTQAGTGDPSPTNIRAISGIGLYDKSITLNGTNATFSTNGQITINNILYDRFITTSLSDKAFGTSNVESSAFKNPNDTEFICGRVSTVGVEISIAHTKLSAYSVAGFNSYLASNPLTVWYQSTSYSAATTFYEVAEVTDSTGYHAYAIQIDAPLFDGDTADIVSGEVHRKYKYLTITGDENFSLGTSFTNNSRFSLQNRTSSIVEPNGISSHFPFLANYSGDSCHFYVTSSTLFLFAPYKTLSDFTSYLKAQYSAGTPVQILYELASETDTTVTGNNVTNAEGTVSVSAENTMNVSLSVYSDYTKNSDYIFTGDLYNTLCDNITTEYANYLKTGLSVDLGTFAIAYQLMLSDFCDNINNFIDTFNEIYQENICNNQNSVPLLQIQKDKNTNTLIATSPALIKAGKTDITNNTLPSALELYYNYIINKKCCKVKIIYADSIKNDGLTYSNTRIHRIREIK